MSFSSKRIKAVSSQLLLGLSISLLTHEFLPTSSLAVLSEQTDATACEPIGTIRTLEQLTQEILQGLELDFSDPEQKRAFDIYRRTHFGDPSTALHASSWDQLETVYRTQRESLNKEDFIDYRISSLEYPRHPDWEALSKEKDERSKKDLEWINSLGSPNRSRQWEKILQFTDEESFQNWWKNANERYPELKSTKNKEKIQAKLKLLLERWHSINASSEKKDLSSLSSTLAQAIDSFAWDFSQVSKKQKNQNGLRRVRSYKTFIHHRNELADEVTKGSPISIPQENSFFSLLDRLGTPTGSYLEQQKKVVQIETETLSLTPVTGSTKTVRHLTLAESPFRSCVGKDCSSRTYFDAALNPNYHYFTLTDSNGKSSGQITLVLGTASGLKCAMIDKVQNLSTEILPSMIEAIRRSVERNGYTLVLPTDLGDHNGISNSEETRLFIDRSISQNRQLEFQSFQPSISTESFRPFVYSKGYQSPSVRSILPLTSPETYHYQPSPRTRPASKQVQFNIESIIQSIDQFKEGDDQEKLRFISALESLKESYSAVDAKDYFGTESIDARFIEKGRKVLNDWLHNPQINPEIKIRSLLTLWHKYQQSYSEMAPLLRTKDQLELLNFILRKPDLKATFTNKLAYNSDGLRKHVLQLSRDEPKSNLPQEAFELIFRGQGKTLIQWIRTPELKKIPFDEIFTIAELKLDWNHSSEDEFKRKQSRTTLIEKIRPIIQNADYPFSTKAKALELLYPEKGEKIARFLEDKLIIRQDSDPATLSNDRELARLLTFQFESNPAEQRKYLIENWKEFSKMNPRVNIAELWAKDCSENARSLGEKIWIESEISLNEKIELLKRIDCQSGRISFSGRISLSNPKRHSELLGELIQQSTHSEATKQKMKAFLTLKNLSPEDFDLGILLLDSKLSESDTIWRLSQISSPETLQFLVSATGGDVIKGIPEATQLTIRTVCEHIALSSHDRNVLLNCIEKRDCPQAEAVQILEKNPQLNLKLEGKLQLKSGR